MVIFEVVRGLRFVFRKVGFDVIESARRVLAEDGRAAVL